MEGWKSVLISPAPKKLAQMLDYSPILQRKINAEKLEWIAWGCYSCRKKIPGSSMFVVFPERTDEGELADITFESCI